MAIVGVLACLGVLALIVAGAVLATSLRLFLSNRKLLNDAQKARIRRDTAKRLVRLKAEKGRVLR